MRLFAARAHLAGGAYKIGIPLRHQFQSEAEWAIALLRSGWARDDEALCAARERLAGVRAGLIRLRSHGGNRVESFFLHILIELFCRQIDDTRVAAIADDEQPGR